LARAILEDGRAIVADDHRPDQDQIAHALERSGSFLGLPGRSSTALGIEKVSADDYIRIGDDSCGGGNRLRRRWRLSGTLHRTGQIPRTHFPGKVCVPADDANRGGKKNTQYRSSRKNFSGLPNASSGMENAFENTSESPGDYNVNDANLKPGKPLPARELN